MLNFIRRKIINFYCHGYSSRKQWKLFHEIFSQNKNFKNLALLGVYHGKDLAFMCCALYKNKIKDFKIYAVDLFEDVPGKDWGNQNLKWADINHGPPPSLEKSKNIINMLGFEKHVNFIKGDFSLLKNINKKLDFAYIDLSHDYQTTIDAINLVSSLSHKETVIMGDDFFDGETLGSPWGVKKAVKEKFTNFTIHQNYFWESNIQNLK
mgnify:CR=1 FL=1|tara:strand:+ start:53 stop:676 length:624 start_codon:yes stop_codon:yes gene_type:complete